MNPDQLRQTVRTVAERWVEPEYPARAQAVDETLAKSRFTAESVAFSVNHAADLIAREGLDAWVTQDPVPFSGAVGVLSRTGTPVEGLFESLAVLLAGCEVAIDARSAVVLAFLGEVLGGTGLEQARRPGESAVLEKATAVFGSGNEEDRAAWHARLDQRHVPRANRLLRPIRTGVAVLSGEESRADLSGLAEDMLLHEGGTPYSVRVVLAPAGHSPDALLSALAGFREVFPPHPETDGSLAMQVAFLEAMGRSLAVGPGFLLSRGDFEVQHGAHLRWVEYDDIGNVVAAVSELMPAELFVATAPATARLLDDAGLTPGTPILGFGDAHRPEVGQPPLTPDVPAFLGSLAGRDS